MKKSVKILLIISLLSFFFVFCFSSYKLVGYYLQRHKEEIVVNELVKDYEIVLPPDEEDICPISIDFDSLKKKNSHIVAWIYSESLSLNYPIVKGNDNSEYLHKGLDGNYLFAGTLFLDFLNNSDFSDMNNIVYGHNMGNGTMFHNIVKFKKQSFYDQNHVIWLLTPDETYHLLPFSGMVVKTKSDAYRIFRDENYFKKFINIAKDASSFTSDVDLSDCDRVVTLSTCTYDFYNARYVLICKMCR